MYRALLRAQWKTTAILTLALALVAFAIPVIQVLTARDAAGGARPELASILISRLLESGPVYPLFALAAGTFVAAATGFDDSQGKFVYALILPVPRWYYLLLRLAVGFTYLGAVVAALWLSALIASAQAALPPGLHAYPGGLTVRFALATGIVFAMMFALMSSSQRTQRRLAFGVVGVFALVTLLGILGVTDPVVRFFTRVAQLPSLIDAFTGRWTLFDV